MEMTVQDACFGNVFKSLRFHLSTLETELFQEAPLLKPFSKASVFISVFARFKRIKKCAFYFMRKRLGVFVACENSRPSSLAARVPLERRRTAVFAG